jgi:hypothetical protein
VGERPRPLRAVPVGEASRARGARTTEARRGGFTTEVQRRSKADRRRRTTKADLHPTLQVDPCSHGRGCQERLPWWGAGAVRRLIPARACRREREPPESGTGETLPAAVPDRGRGVTPNRHRPDPAGRTVRNSGRLGDRNPSGSTRSGSRSGSRRPAPGTSAQPSRSATAAKACELSPVRTADRSPRSRLRGRNAPLHAWMRQIATSGPGPQPGPGPRPDESRLNPEPVTPSRRLFRIDVAGRHEPGTVPTGREEPFGIWVA